MAEKIFLSTPSARRATHGLLLFLPDISISIHALREEGDLRTRKKSISNTRFLSTPSARRATTGSKFWFNCNPDFYPRPPRGGRHALDPLRRPANQISIHALREEGDHLNNPSRPPASNFYPRPPRGGRPNGLVAFATGYIFLSTPSARRATTTKTVSRSETALFLSTPSARRATGTTSKTLLFGEISIHALREEGDHSNGNSLRHFCNFYPRPPRGGRRGKGYSTQGAIKFLSTPSARRATGQFSVGLCLFQFLSTPSARRATADCFAMRQGIQISIHALREEGDSRDVDG